MSVRRAVIAVRCCCRIGAGTGALAGLSRHAASPQDCFRSAPSAALHGAALYGITGGVITVPLAIISAS